MSGRDGDSDDEPADGERRHPRDEDERSPRDGGHGGDRQRPPDEPPRSNRDEQPGQPPWRSGGRPPQDPSPQQPHQGPPQQPQQPHQGPPQQPQQPHQGPPPKQPQQPPQASQTSQSHPAGPGSSSPGNAAVPAPRGRGWIRLHRRGPRGGRSPRSRLRRERRRTARAEAESTNWDPVQVAFADRLDLYDIATWEVRTGLDSFAVSVTNSLRTGRRVALIAVALALFLTQAAIAVLIILEEPLIGVLAVSSVLPALAVAGYLWYGDPTRREPFATLAATFVLSMLFASFAGVINTTLGPAFELFGFLGLVAFYFIVVGPIEEFVKWLAIRVHAYRTDAFRTVVDGVVYGAVAGVGFAAIENLIYIIIVYLEAGDMAGIGPTEAATWVAAQRFFVGPGHVVFSAWAGFYLGLAKFNPENRGPIVVKGLLIAAFIHALYNTSVSILGESLPVLGLFGFIVLYHGFWFALLYRKVRAYRELYRARFPHGRPGHSSRDRRAGQDRRTGHIERSNHTRQSGPSRRTPTSGQHGPARGVGQPRRSDGSGRATGTAQSEGPGPHRASEQPGPSSGFDPSPPPGERTRR